MFRTRLVLLSWILFADLVILVVYGAPSVQGLFPRIAAPQFASLDTAPRPWKPSPSNASANATPLTNTTILIRDRHGVDISSSFQVKVFYQPPITHTTNLTEGSNLHNRQVSALTQIIRKIDSCYGNETFIESHCVPEDEEASMQAYEYTCRKVVDHWRAATGEYMGQSPAYRARKGDCEPNEMCVDGFGTEQIASCVHTAVFDDFTIDKDGRIKGMLHGEIFDVAKAYAVISKKDQTTPMQTKRLKMGASSSVSVGGSGKVQNKMCRNCADLELDLLEPNADSLRVEATLMSTAAVAGTGILWLALSAG